MIGAIGTITKELVKGVADLEINYQLQTIWTTA